MRFRQAFFQRVAASLIIPITLLPLAAILLAIGSQLGIAPIEAAGRALIQIWLPLFFGLGIAIGFTESDGMGVLSVVAGFLSMTAVAEKVAGDPALNVGVLGGIVVGGVCTWIFNRAKEAELPEYLALFSGKRLGPVISAAAGVVLGYGFGIFWPPIHTAIVDLGLWLYGAGGLGAFVYGALLRLLIPTGLHHILMQLVDYQIGSWMDPATGQNAVGEYVRFLAGDPAAGRILSGFFLTLGFGPLGAALAMTHAARPEQKRKVGGLMTTAALTAMLLGVTEPVEFAFIFASPLLFGIHMLYSGLASYLGYALNIHLAGYALPMILINWHRQQNGWLIFPLGLAFTVLYYVTFRAVIAWRRPPILGQVPEEAETETAPPSEEGAAFLGALGGAGNIATLDACMTRLRLTLREPGRVDERRLKQLGAAAILQPGDNDLQVVVGARAGDLATKMRSAMVGGEAAPAVAAKAVPTVCGEREIILVSPLSGQVVPLEQVPDPVFADRLAGDGVAVAATGGRIVAPAAGHVSVVFPGGHAIGIVTPEGLELLLHIGLDTVSLQGEGFSISVHEGDEVTPGAEIGRFDPALLAARGRSLVSPVLVTNPDALAALTVLAEGGVETGEPLLRVRLNG